MRRSGRRQSRAGRAARAGAGFLKSTKEQKRHEKQPGKGSGGVPGHPTRRQKWTAAAVGGVTALGASLNSCTNGSGRPCVARVRRDPKGKKRGVRLGASGGRGILRSRGVGLLGVGRFPKLRQLDQIADAEADGGQIRRQCDNVHGAVGEIGQGSLCYNCASTYEAAATEADKYK